MPHMHAESNTSQGQPLLPRTTVALNGVLAVVAALAVGHLAAAFVGPNASPYLAVGNSAIDLTPGWLKEFAVRNFGTNDKLVLLLGMGVVLLIIAIIAGLLSRRSPLPGAALAAVIGLLGVAAVVTRPDLGLLGVLAPVVSLVVGVVVFVLLHRVASGRLLAGGQDTDAGRKGVGDWPSRRRFLLASACVAAGAAVAGVGGQLIGAANNARASRRALGAIKPKQKAPSIPANADFAQDGTPTFITSNAKFYRVDTALTVPQIRAEDWTLRIHGMVEREKTFTFDDIRNRDLVERTITLTCVSNEVGGRLISNTNFIGVPMRDLLEEVGVHDSANQLFSTSSDGYTAGTPVDALLDPERGALLAIGMNGEPLPLEHGFPARMVTPGLYGYLSATKWVVDMELTTFDAKQGYWVPRGYALKAPIKTESRIDKPGGFEKVSGGRVVVAGIAWAQPKGIKKVEVRLDQGKWQEAELATEVNGSTWRMWRTEVNNLSPGFHTVESRATDKSGYVQTDKRVAPLPNGASGWHSVQFSVQ